MVKQAERERAKRDWVVLRLRTMIDDIESGKVAVATFSEPHEVEDIPDTNPVQRRINGARSLRLSVSPPGGLP